MKKRIFAVVLTLAMLIGMLPTVALAAEDEKTQVAVLLVDGQSNADGTSGELNGVAPDMPEEGYGYIWNAETGALDDLNTCVTEQVADDQAAGENKSIGFHPALAKTWYDYTGEVAVIIHKGTGGSNILGWADYEGNVTSRTTNNAADVKACIEAIQTTGTMEIAHVGYFWLQGESDACPNTVSNAANCIYSTADEYYTAFKAVHDTYVAALETSGVDAFGGILAVRTREALLDGYNGPNEYCGVRVAQQDLANQNADIYMASVLTEDWTVSANPEMFSSSGGPIHYTQAGYNALGEDAAGNMAVAVGGAIYVESIKLFGEDGGTVYAEGDTIYVEENARAIGDLNTDEAGSAQLVAQPWPLTAVCDGVTMTLTNAAGETVEGLIDNNGYIADMSKVTEDLTLTVKAGDVEQSYTLAPLPEYYWDFTNADAISGSVVSAVEEGNWTANDLTYNGGDVPFNSETVGVSKTDATKYFTTAKDVTLRADTPWTIEWAGTMQTASIVFSDATDAGDAKHFHLWYDGTGAMNLRGNTGSNLMTAPNFGITSGAQATWYVSHDGSGTLTLAVYSGGELQTSSAANAVTADYTIDTVMGYYNSASPFGYKGGMQYMKIYTDALVFDVDDFALEAPYAGNKPQTTVSGADYTGTVTWEPAIETVFGDETEYTASVTLTADAGKMFVPGVEPVVTDGTVSNTAVSADGATLTFDITYPATGIAVKDIVLSGLAVDVTAPLKGAVPGTAVSGEGYTGTVAWTPTDATFADETEYTASVTLAAANGYVFDEAPTVTVEGAEVSNVTVTNTEDDSTLTFDAAFAALEAAQPDTTNEFYWDFTDTTAASGNVVSAVEGDGWAANDLVWSKTSVSLAESGFNPAAKGYFVMAQPVTLSQSEPWTIEWQGTITGSSSFLSYTDGGTLATNTALVYVAGNGTDKYTLHLKVGGADKAALSQSTEGIPDAVRTSSDTIWTLTHDGSGNLTIGWTTADGVTAYVKSGKITQDYTFDTLFGYFMSGTPILYQGTVKYVKLTRDFTLLSEQAVAITAPVAEKAPQTTVTADAYTGTISWTPALENGKFASETEYTASVALTAAEGYLFGAGATAAVEGASSVSNAAVSADGTTMSFDAKFPATEYVVKLTELAVDVTAPVKGAVPDTDVSGEGYTGTATWTPADAAFALDTAYTASVTLTAANGYVFEEAASVTVADGTVSGVTVDAEGATLTFNVAFAALTEAAADTTNNFYWDFTDTTAVNGNVLSAVEGDGWAANDLVYAKTSVTLGEGGMVSTSSANGRSHFLMEKPVTLSQSEPWTIEWKGSMTASSTVIANTAGGTLSQADSLIFVANNSGTADQTQMYLKKTGNVNAATSGYITDAAKQSADTVWYLVHDGEGNLTMGYKTADEVSVNTYTGKITQDYTFDTVLGYFLSTSTSFNYYGTIQYLKLYREAADLHDYISGEQAVTITAPVKGETPVTSVTGDHYTGTVTWTPAADTFAPDTAYTASVVLTADTDMYYLFAADTTVTVAGAASVEDVSVSDDGTALSFTAQFPKTSPDYGINYYWDFTDTGAASGSVVSAVESEKWSANDLTYTKGDVTLTESGMDNYAHDRGYFLMETPVVLAQDQAWTIEWKGSMPTSSAVLANVDAEAGTRGEYIFVANATGAADKTAVMLHTTDGVQRTQMSAIPDAIKQSTDTVWYISSDGEGNLTMAYKNGNGVAVTLKKGLVDRDYTFNAVMGYVISTSKYHNYGGVMEYMKIYTYDALAVEELALNAPVTGETLQTTIPTDGRYTASVEWDPAGSTVAEAETGYTALITLTAADDYTFSENTLAFVRGAKIDSVAVAEDGRTVTLYAEFPVTNKTADTDSNFYWDFTDTGAVNGNVVSSVVDEQFASNSITYSKDSVPMTESGLTNGGSSHGYFTMDTPVYLPVNEQWTIEWKGGTDSSSILMANNTSNLQDDHIDSNGSGHKTSEFIYIYNNYAATQPDNNFVTISMGCTALAGESAAGFGGISKAQRASADSVWYLINDENGDLRLEYWAAGSTEADLVVNRNNDLLRTDCTFDSLLGYFTEAMPINYSGKLEYLKIYRAELMNQVELAMDPGVSTLSTSLFSADIDWSTMAAMSMVSETSYAYATATLTAKDGYRFSDRMEINIPGAVYTEINSISADGKTAVVTAVFEISREYLLGDVNADGSVNDVDATILARCVAGWTGYEELVISAAVADIDGNGDIEDADVIILARYLAGWGADYDKYFADHE